MNWLGRIVQKHVTENDTVLDLGCGIMQAITTSQKDIPEYSNYNLKTKIRLFIFNNSILKCKSLLGCDITDSYLKYASKYFPVIHIGMNELNRFINNSYDVVICLDVLEHLDLETAKHAIKEMKRICRKKVIVYTPSKFSLNKQNERAWGLDQNIHQIHLSFIEPKTLQDEGFMVTFPKQSKNTLAIFKK